MGKFGLLLADGNDQRIQGGLRIAAYAVSPTTDLFFYDFRLFSLMMPVRCIVDALEAWEALPVTCHGSISRASFDHAPDKREIPAACALAPAMLPSGARDRHRVRPYTA